MKTRIPKLRAFTLVEILVVVALLGILTTIGLSSLSGLRDSSNRQKKISDISILNSSVKAYLGSGGQLPADASVDQVFLTLKKRISSGSRTLGLAGAKLDPRLTYEMQSDTEAASNEPRIYWNGPKQYFYIADSGSAPGIKRIFSDPNLAETDFGETEVESTFLYAKKDTWVWDYKDATATAPAGPSSISLTPGSTAPPPPNPTPPSDPVTPPADPPASVLSLDAPAYSIPQGSYPVSSFDMPVALINPNPTGSSQVYYSLDYGNWKIYSGPIPVPPGGNLAAQAIAISDDYRNSSRVDSRYDVISENLKMPIISPSLMEFGIFNHQKSNIIIANPNDEDLSYVEYRLSNGDWKTYSTPFSVDRDQYPEGVLIEARALPIDPDYYKASEIANSTITAENAALSGDSTGVFHDPSGPAQMVSNLSGTETGSYFSWGRDTYTAAELEHAGDPSHLAERSKSWLNYEALSFNSIPINQRFQLGELTYFNGTIASGTGADGISFTVDLNLELQNEKKSSIFNFDFELVNVPNIGDPSDPWVDADFVRLAQPVATETVKIGNLTFQLQLEFGATSPNGISYFDEFHVLEGHDATTALYGTFIEL